MFSLLDHTTHGKKAKKILMEDYMKKLGILEEMQALNKKRFRDEEEEFTRGVLVKKEAAEANNVLSPLRDNRTSESVSPMQEKGSFLVNFELFCVKWERCLLIEKEMKELQNNSDRILKHIRESAIDVIINIHTVGSANTNTLRKNFIQIDVIVEYLNNKESLMTKIKNLIEDLYCLNQKDISFEYVTIDNSFYKSEGDKVFIQFIILVSYLFKHPTKCDF
jgi:hypothetical protein